ncbi:hypothetical protein N9150_01325, partial [Akkermansiaceae bacterium]|nr:hypothetical protein [Akkermansiaceae bacterium]
REAYQKGYPKFDDTIEALYTLVEESPAEAASWISMSSLIWSAILFLVSVCATASPAVAINITSNFFAFMGKGLDET